MGIAKEKLFLICFSHVEHNINTNNHSYEIHKVKKLNIQQ
jgi:hypothetical protein